MFLSILDILLDNIDKIIDFLLFLVLVYNSIMQYKKQIDRQLILNMI